MDIKYFYQNSEKIGLLTRTNTIGKEFDLVQDFITYYENQFKRYNKKKSLAIFVEPLIDGSFPDIVFATYNPIVFKNWNKSRMNLTTTDLKILSIFLNNHSCDTDYLASLGYSYKEILKSVENLLDSNLIRRYNKSWRVNKKSTFIGITNLVVVEAKISNVQSVYTQTLMNNRFATESYALIDSQRPSAETQKIFNDSGLGLYATSDKFHKVVSATKRKFPNNYISLQFNEWIGKILNVNGDSNDGLE